MDHLPGLKRAPRREGSRDRICFGVSLCGDGGCHHPEGLCRQRRSAQREQPTDRPPLYQGGGPESDAKTAHCSVFGQALEMNRHRTTVRAAGRRNERWTCSGRQAPTSAVVNGAQRARQPVTPMNSRSIGCISMACSFWICSKVRRMMPTASSKPVPVAFPTVPSRSAPAASRPTKAPEK